MRTGTLGAALALLAITSCAAQPIVWARPNTPAYVAAADLATCRNLADNNTPVPNAANFSIRRNRGLAILADIAADAAEGAARAAAVNQVAGNCMRGNGYAAMMPGVPPMIAEAAPAAGEPNLPAGFPPGYSTELRMTVSPVLSAALVPPAPFVWTPCGEERPCKVPTTWRDP